jgi:ribonucleotide reductase beta subunit family protein with ferritin-like domain
MRNGDLMQVQKRDGSIENFQDDKIKRAVALAMSRTDVKDESLKDSVVSFVKNHISTGELPHVDEVHELVEDGLMDAKAFSVAREYITYRDKNMPDIFRSRTAYKPFEYPHLGSYVDAIQQSYWIVSEYNFSSDIHDFKAVLLPHEKEAVKRSMLAISQVEVAVKTFWGKIGDRMPKPEIQEVGASFSESECFSDDTEVLTEDGWKYFKDLDKTEEVAQYNMENGEVSFVKPSGYIKRYHEGEMHLYQSKGTDICVTPRHEILVMHPQKDYYEKRKSENGLWCRNYRYPTSGYKTGTKSFTDVDRLLVAIQADGCLLGGTPSGKGKVRRDFSFNLSKQRKVDRLIEILDAIGIDYYKRQGRDEFTIISGRLPEGIESTSNIKCFGFINLSEVGSDYCEKFFEELKYWDAACRVGRGSYTYYNTNEAAVDKIMALGTLGGFNVNKGMNRTSEQSMMIPNPDGKVCQSSKDCYAVSVRKSDKTVYPKRESIDYSGFVYCVTVPESNIVTRRNKRVAISGNCRHSRAYSHLLELLGLNKEFEKVLEVPAIKKRVEYAKKALAKSKTDSNQDYLESVLLFTLFIENVSLFSQFLILSTLNKEKSVLKGMSNVIAATSLEEQLHNNFGCAIVNEIRKEHPDWFTEELESHVQDMVMEAFEAESSIVEWIFEEGELSYLSKDSIIEYIKNRFNMGLLQAGFKEVFKVDEVLLEGTLWFDLQNNSTMHTDFFSNKPVNYTKFSQSFDSNDLF